MAFPISKQVLLASPVPLSSENLSRYLCAPTGRKYNLSMGLFPFHWGKAVFPWCVQDSRAHPHYSEHLWQLSSSILSVHILVPISRADPARRGSPAWILCQGLHSVEFHRTSVAGLSRCSLMSALLLFFVRAKEKGEANAFPQEKGFSLERSWEISQETWMTPGKPGKVLQRSCLTRSLGFTCFSGKPFRCSPVET